MKYAINTAVLLLVAISLAGPANAAAKKPARSPGRQALPPRAAVPRS
jgi:hypothetical protein